MLSSVVDWYSASEGWEDYFYAEVKKILDAKTFWEPVYVLLLVTTKDLYRKGIIDHVQ